jgi:hypothetical protein
MVDAKKKFGIVVPSKSKFAPIAQPVEQLPFKEKVPGSNPGGRTKDCRLSSAGRAAVL